MHTLIKWLKRKLRPAEEQPREDIDKVFDVVARLEQSDMENVMERIREGGVPALYFIFHDKNGRSCAVYADDNEVPPVTRHVFPYEEDENGNKVVRLTPMSWEKFTRAMRESMLEKEQTEVLFEKK